MQCLGIKLVLIISNLQNLAQTELSQELDIKFEILLTSIRGLLRIR